MTVATEPSTTPTVHSPTALTIRGLRKSFGAHEVLKGIDLDIPQGEFLTLLGPSGSGKTTLLRIIAGFEQLTSGTMDLRGKDISRLEPAQRGLGMVFQQYALFPHMTVAQNISYGLKLRKWEAGRLRMRTEEMLEMVGLGPIRDRRPASLSGGQQQRVALARALAYEPELLLMDEPLGALDRSLRLHMEEEIRRVHRQLGTTIVYVTHDQEEALVLSDRIAIMDGGEFVGLDTASNLFQRPPCSFVAKFFSDSVVLDARAVPGAGGESVVESAFGTFRTAGEHRGPVKLAVRPRSFTVGSSDAAGITVSGAVRDVILLGEDRRIELDVPGIGSVMVKEDISTPRALALGQDLVVHAAAPRITVMPS
jgi:putative spermidine/putrescine transport system ATP-binding protein